MNIFDIQLFPSLFLFSSLYLIFFNSPPPTSKEVGGRVGRGMEGGMTVPVSLCLGGDWRGTGHDGSPGRSAQGVAPFGWKCPPGAGRGVCATALRQFPCRWPGEVFFFYNLFPGLKLWENSRAVVKPEGRQHPQTRAGTPAGTRGPPGVLGRPPWPLAKEGALLGQPMLLGQTSTLGSHEN